MFQEKAVLKKFAKFRGKHMCRSFCFRHRCSPVNLLIFEKFLTTVFLIERLQVTACRTTAPSI